MANIHKYTHYKGILRPCCADENNLTSPIKVENGAEARICRKCKRRHFSMIAEPGHLGLVGNGLREKQITEEQLHDLLVSILPKERKHMVENILRSILTKQVRGD